ncbi:helicase associated domain-containing protein [Sinomonas soli]
MRQDLVRELALQITGLPAMPAARPRPERFLARLSAARAFQVAERRLPNPSAADPDEAELGDWLRTQRARARTGSATPQERALLEDGLGRHWDDPVARDRADTAWDRQLARYKAFTARHGHRPRPVLSGTERNLYDWAGAQRRALLDGSRPDRIERLLAATRGTD